MRRRSILSLLALTIVGAAVFSCYSCTPENKDPEVPAPENKDDDNQGGQEENKPGEGDGTSKAGTYKFVASPMKGAWEAGDQIYVHGNIGTQTEVITLSASDISADGRTATATVGAEALTSPAEPDSFYAAWPAEAVYMFKGVLKIKTTFERCEDLLTISYLSGDTFNFIDVSSLLSFTVDGDYDSYAIASNDRNGICITRFEAEYSSETKKFNPKRRISFPLRNGIFRPAVQNLVPRRLQFPEGIYPVFGQKRLLDCNLQRFKCRLPYFGAVSGPWKHYFIA